MIPLTLDEVPAGYIGWELFTKGSPDNSIFFPTRRAAEGYSRRFCGRCDLTFERHRPSADEVALYWASQGNIYVVGERGPKVFVPPIDGELQR